MTETPEIMVTVQNLVKRFGTFTAVDQVSFEVRRGEIFGFLGPNGAGKSTTIRILCGLLAPTSGEGRLAGFDLRREAESIKTKIGYMSQKFSLYEDLTVEENIDFYGGIYRIPASRRSVRKEWALEMAGLAGRRSSRTSTLPAGWKQRLALGCAVLHEPPLLFLDEPTSGVDPVSRRLFWDLIYQLAGTGSTIFVTTHYMDEAEYCHRLGLIYRGRLIASGTPAELKKNLMKEAILEITRIDARHVLDLLEECPEVREAALFGNGIHAVVEDPVRARPAIARFLAGHGLPEALVETIPLSLEDVFVSLIESYDREHQAPEEVRR